MPTGLSGNPSQVFFFIGNIVRQIYQRTADSGIYFLFYQRDELVPEVVAAVPTVAVGGVLAEGEVMPIKVSDNLFSAHLQQRPDDAPATGRDPNQSSAPRPPQHSEENGLGLVIHLMPERYPIKFPLRGQ
jgi:hypothetical protein